MDDSEWRRLVLGYETYLTQERNLAANTVESYLRDVRQFGEWIGRDCGLAPSALKASHIEAFMASLFDQGVAKSTQARMLSGIRSFFTYLVLAGENPSTPTEFVDSPKVGRHLPDVLTLAEIDALVAAIDLSQPQGHRNLAIIEVMYSCGLRVSEVVSLRLGDLFFDDGFIRVVGKGDKQRLVPVSDVAKKYILHYLGQRAAMKVDRRSADVLFLNRRGNRLTRVMIFTLLRQTAQAAGITKTISPHTLRHSFATHLLTGGASIRQVQEMLGHESITTTEIYTHLDTRHLQKTLETFHPLSKNNS